MKNLFSVLFVLCLMQMVFTSSTYAQSDDTQLFLVQSTKVKPAKVAEYDKATQKFVKSIADANIRSVQWYANVTDDFTYFYAVPIENLAALDKPYWKEAMEKIGVERVMAEASASDPFVENQRLEVYSFNPSFSYVHANLKGNTSTYREWTNYRFERGTGQQVVALVKEWKALYTKHNIEFEYQVYFGGLGTDENTVVTVDFAKNAAELGSRRAKAIEKMGEEGEKLWAKTIAILIDRYDVAGYFRPDLTYIPKKETVAVDKK